MIEVLKQIQQCLKDKMYAHAEMYLLEAIAELESQEPVAVVDANDDGYWADILPNRNVKVGQFLYAHPPQRTEQGEEP
jgi:hypothetical protein